MSPTPLRPVAAMPSLQPTRTRPTAAARKRVALVTWSYDEHQGISRCVVEVAARLAATHEVHVFAAALASAGSGGVQLHQVPLRLTQPHLAEYEFYLRAGRRIAQGGFDIVHAHFPVACKVDVYTCHGMPRMALRAFRQFPPPVRADVPLWRMARWYLQLPLHAQAVQRPQQRLVAVSNKVAAELAEHCGRDLSSVQVVANGVDLERFSSATRQRLRAESRARLAAQGLGDDRFVLLWVGNHLRHKGLRWALQTLDRLPPRALLVAVGADQPASVPELAADIARLKAQRRLHFEPVDVAIERHYAGADVLLFPSLYESFGLVVLEAAAMGLPVATARTVAFADEHLRDGQSAMLVDAPWHCDALADRLHTLMAQPLLARRIGAAGQAVARHFGWSRNAAAYSALYAALQSPTHTASGRTRHAT